MPSTSDASTRPTPVPPMTMPVKTTPRTGKAAPIAGLPFTRADIEQTVPERFAQVVRRFPGQVALTGQGRRWTYRELDDRANRIAHAIGEKTRFASLELGLRSWRQRLRDVSSGWE